MLAILFETAIPGIELPQTYAVDRTATGIGTYIHYVGIMQCVFLLQQRALNFKRLNTSSFVGLYS
jgi:hypothetical protein